MPTLRHPPNARPSRTGHTLIELMVATMLLAVGLLAVAALTTRAARRAALAQRRSATLDDVRGAIATATARRCADTATAPPGWTLVASPRRTRLVGVRTSWSGPAGAEPLVITTEAPCRE